MSDEKSVAHQYIIRDHQQLHYPYFRITEKHYSSIKAARADWEKGGPEFKVVGRLHNSRVDHPWIVAKLTAHEHEGDEAVFPVAEEVR